MFYADLHQAIKRRLDVVADQELRRRDPAMHLEELKRAAADLDALAAALPLGTDPMLRHYLERQSYVKALDLLSAQISRK